MTMIKIANNAFTYPMPVVLVGAVVNRRPNFLAVGWVSQVNHDPPMIAVALGKDHHTNPGIRASKAFSVNIPGVDLVAKTDYCGIISGKTADKSKLFTVFTGKVTGAPMIEECRLCVECRLVKIVKLVDSEVFIGKIAGVYAHRKCLRGGKPDVAKLDPLTLTMPGNDYRRIGASVGKAWSAGKKVKG
jgi:flavin reductase (DIM6/NTAB) family NADH-FMN oxidoreductase RutF